VEIRLTRWAGFETPVDPQILFGLFKNPRLDKLVDAKRILCFVTGWKILQGWINLQVVSTSASPAGLGKCDDLRFAEARQLAGRRNRRCRYAKQRYKNSVFRTVILIRCVPYRTPVAQSLYHGSDVIPGNCLAVHGMTFTAVALNIVIYGVVVRAIGSIDRQAKTEQLRANIDMSEMKGHQNNAGPVVAGGLQMLQTFYRI